MTTAVNMLVSQVGDVPDLRASTPPVFQFEKDAVSLGSTKRGKPPRGITIRTGLLLFLLGLLGFIVMLHGLNELAQNDAVAVSRHRTL